MKLIALLTALVALAVAQHWDIEKVDSAGWGAAVDMRWHPDGRLFLCYQDTAGRIRVATKDSAWSYDSVIGTSGDDGLDFSISAQGAVAIAWLKRRHEQQLWVASNLGDSWVYDSTGLMATGPGPAEIAHDTAGIASVVYTCIDGNGISVVRARFADSLWSKDTIVTDRGVRSVPRQEFYCREYLINTRDSASVLFMHATSNLLSSNASPGPRSAHPFYSEELDVARESPDSWVVTQKDYAWWPVWLSAEAMALDPLGAPQVCWRDADLAFRYEGESLDTLAYNSSVAIDRLNRPCIAYTRPELMFTGKLDGQWRSSAVSQATTYASSVALALDHNGEPLVAFSTADGLWLANGVGIMGQSEEQGQPTAHGSPLTASVIRNVLLLPEASSLKPQATSWLLDAAGRRAFGLHPGANDLSSLSPGVYFVREAQAQAQAQAVRKVVITR